MLFLLPYSISLPTTRSQTCNPALDEALESAEIDFYPSNSTSTKSFISDHLQSMDFCENPDLLRLVSRVISFVLSARGMILQAELGLYGRTAS